MEALEKLNLKFWKNRKVLVTGATGIVGSWLIKDLIKLSAKVIVLIYEPDVQSELYRSKDIKRVATVNGQLEDFKTLEKLIAKNSVDTVFHLGAQAIVGTAQRFPLATFESNIRGSYNLLEACRVHKDTVQHIVVASSDKAYGEQPRLPYIEDMPLDGREPYEVSKSCTDLIAQSYYHSYGLPIAIVRCGNIYGGGDLNWSRIVPGTIRSFLHNEPPIIRSDGTYIRDYVYVKDVARTYLKLAESLDDKKFRGQAFNFSSETPLKVIELVSMIGKLTNRQHIQPKILNNTNGEIHSQYLSSGKIQKMLHWKAHYSLEQGLIETINWYKAFFANEH